MVLCSLQCCYRTQLALQHPVSRSSCDTRPAPSTSVTIQWTVNHGSPVFFWSMLSLTKYSILSKWEGLHCTIVTGFLSYLISQMRSVNLFLETIHLFFDCHVAKFVWNVVFFSFGVQPPSSVSHMLGSWPRGFPLKLRKQLLVQATVMCWDLWLSRNNAVFNQLLPNSYLQVIFRGAY